MINDFFDIDSKYSFYWAGFIAADGCVGNMKSKSKYNYKYLAIHLSKNDYSHLQKFKNIIKCNTNISLYKKECKLTILSDSLYDHLGKKFNIVPRKTRSYVFPKYVINHKYCNHYMRGYFDGDGCFSSQSINGGKEQLRFSLLGTKDFLEEYQKILISKCNINTNRKIIQVSGTYCLQYGGNKIIPRIYKYLYNNADESTYMERKIVKINCI